MNEIARREFVLSTARRCLGVSLLPCGGGVASLAEEASTSRQPAPNTKARSVIYLFMKGGMSHLDTLDPKPETTDVQGPVAAIATSVPGTAVTEWLPKLAQRADMCALVRSLHHTQGNHEPGQYKMLTGYEQRADLIHPSVGAWSMRLAGRNNPRLPGYVRVGGLAGHPANGFFEVKYAPLPIAKPDAGLQNGRLRDGMTPESFRRNLDLAAALDRPSVGRYDQPRVRAYADLYEDAVRMMASSDIDAFDIAKEAAETRDAYGRSAFGAGCLLARRLVERGVRFVEVDHGGWDTHVDNHKGVREACVDLDSVLSALLDDLKSRGLLDSTLVVLVTEFGRSPEIDQNAGRNHHPLAFSCLMAGGGVRGGQVYGTTDATGHRVASDPVTVYDFNATIGYALGLPLEDAFAPTPMGQKFSIIGKDTAPVKGRPVLTLFG